VICDAWNLHKLPFLSLTKTHWQRILRFRQDQCEAADAGTTSMLVPLRRRFGGRFECGACGVAIGVALRRVLAGILSPGFQEPGVFFVKSSGEILRAASC
jgi:hypothetical protein